jgi:hypothetical protein
MSHVEFNQLLHSIDALSPEQMQQLARELANRMAAKRHSPGQGSIGAMRDAADELDEVVEHAMKMRQQPWRLPAGE